MLRANYVDMTYEPGPNMQSVAITHRQLARSLDRSSHHSDIQAANLHVAVSLSKLIRKAQDAQDFR